MKLHLLLRLVYRFFRFLTRVSLPVYFRERHVEGLDHFRFDGPAFVAVNHPNTLTDILNTGLQVRQEMFFLANYGLFRTPFTNWLFRTLFCIPVKRREDMRAGEGRSNEAAFEQSYLHLEKNGVLFIAPEGASWMRRYVSPLKSGVARIAFGAEVRNNWGLKLQIVPVGLTYDAPNLFRSRTAVCAGEPLLVADWRAQYEQNPDRAIDNLLDTLHERLVALGLHARDEHGELMLHYVEQLIHHPKRQPWKSAFRLEREKLPGWLDDVALRAQVKTYFDDLKKHRVHDAGIAHADGGQPVWFSVLFLLLGSPVAIPAALFWFLPCFLPWLINRLSGLYIGYSSTIKLLGGIVFFPLAFWGLYRVAAFRLPNPWPWVAVLVAPLAGLFLERYLDLWLTVKQRLSLKNLDQKTVQNLIARRRNLVDRLTAA